MTALLAAYALALATAQPSAPSDQAEEPGLLVVADKDQSTTVRLIETTDAVQFEFTGPVFEVPSISIDARRNGKIDPDEDFIVSSAPDGSPCLVQMLNEGATSPCGPLGSKAQLVRAQRGNVAITTFTFPKQAISADGFGFGFALEVYNEQGRYRTSLGGGDYQFGGTLHLVEQGPNFTGSGSAVPAEILPAIHRYQGCLNRSTDALVPLERSKLAQLKAVPAGCAAERAAALQQGIQALASSGVDKESASAAISDLFDQIDASFGRLVKAVESGPSPRAQQ